MTEYRLVAKFVDSEIRNRVMPKKTFAKAVKDLEALQFQIESGRLAFYWLGAVVTLEAREVSEWESISE